MRPKWDIAQQFAEAGQHVAFDANLLFHS